VTEKKNKKKPQVENIMACPIPYGGHNKWPKNENYAHKIAGGIHEPSSL